MFLMFFILKPFKPSSTYNRLMNGKIADSGLQNTVSQIELLKLQVEIVCVLKITP